MFQLFLCIVRGGKYNIYMLSFESFLLNEEINYSRLSKFQTYSAFDRLYFICLELFAKNTALLLFLCRLYA